MEYVTMFVEAVMDSLEEFFDAISIPTAKYVSDAFKISLIFVAVAFGCEYFSIWTFVSVPEALTCSIILLIISLIDTATRSEVKGMANKMKTVAAGGVSRLKTVQQNFTYSGESSSEEELNEHPVTDSAEEEELPYGGEQ